MPFQHAEKLGLEAGAHLADLVEHERALVGGLELADLPLRGAGEGARSWPNNSLANRSADSAAQLRQTKTLSCAGTVVMDGPGDQFLAHAALAADQHGGVAGGGAGDLLGHLPNRRAAADDFAADAQPLAQLDVFGAARG